MSDYAVITFLLSITAFYVFLAIYILVHVLSSRAPALAKITGRARKESLQGESEARSNSRLW
jgi:hypothetical protein